MRNTSFQMKTILANCNRSTANFINSSPMFLEAQRWSHATQLFLNESQDRWEADGLGRHGSEGEFIKICSTKLEMD